MNTSAKRLAVGVTAVLLVSAIVLSAGRADDQPPKKDAEPTKLAKDLIGAWVLVGTPDKIGQPPASGGRFKFRTGRH